MTRRRAALAWLAVIAPLWLAMILCTYWEPVVFDGWGNVFWYTWNDLTLANAWDLVEYGWSDNNPRLGQTVTTMLYAPGPYHPIVTPLIELATFWLMTTLALGRWPTLRRADDALAFATVFAIVAACTPQFGSMLIYRPYTGNYLFGLMLNLLWLVPYRLHVEAARAWRAWWSVPSLLVLGFAAGMCNEHTGVAFLALGTLATAWSAIRGDGLRAWMIAGLVGLLVGYVLLLVAPGNDLRYDGLATQVGIVDRILDRGIVDNLVIVGRLLAYIAWTLPWIAIAVVVVVRRAVLPLSRERRGAPIAIAVGGALGTLALLASPLVGARLYFMSTALVGIAIAGWLLSVASGRAKLVCAVLAGAVLVYVEARCIVTYSRVGAIGAERLARIQRGPEGAAIVVPRYDAPRDKWFIGEDFGLDSLRIRVTNLYKLARIELEPR